MIDSARPAFVVLTRWEDRTRSAHGPRSKTRNSVLACGGTARRGAGAYSLSMSRSGRRRGDSRARVRRRIGRDAGDRVARRSGHFLGRRDSAQGGVPFAAGCAASVSAVMVVTAELLLVWIRKMSTRMTERRADRLGRELERRVRNPLSAHSVVGLGDQVKRRPDSVEPSERDRDATSEQGSRTGAIGWRDRAGTRTSHTDTVPPARPIRNEERSRNVR